MKERAAFFLLMLLAGTVHAQELFPLAEPASSVPKGALGIRAFAEGYREDGLLRNITGLKLLYGITPRLSVYLSGTMSDYHERTLPFDLIAHSHTGSRSVGSTATPATGVAYPEIFNSADVYAKYRLLSRDGQNRHFRMAAYAEGSYVAVPSHEAEPELLVHTSGFGAGLISTYLRGHFAASLAGGFILPAAYRGNATDRFGGIYPTTVQYGNAVNYSLSFGYLLFPQQYRSYDQTNWNLYLELTGKTYGAAAISQKDGPAPDALPIPVSVTTPALSSGSYLDIDPGIQCIIRSVYRIDASAGFALLSTSYVHLYPVYHLGVQRYLYFNRRPAAKSDKL